MAATRTLRLGTRGSPLALWQANWVSAALRGLHPGLAIDIVTIRTLAEKFPEREAPEIGVGIFTRELDEALLQGDIELAVHSMKDVPSRLPPGLVIALVPERESPLDAFIAREGTRLEELEPGSKIGTGSPRRRAQLLHRRPDLAVVPLRGNVGTRLRKMEELGLAGTILAHAGLKRLGEEGRITHLLEPELMLPAVNQGAMAVVARAAAPDICALLSALEHTPSRQRVTAERAFLERLRGGCQVPAGALAEFTSPGTLRLDGIVLSLDGTACVRGQAEGEAASAERLGSQLAANLLERGGARLLEDLKRSRPGA